MADTIEGRFGLIAVHLFLVLERIRREGDPGQALGRALLETFMTDIDDNLREIGIGDTGVPPRVKKAAAALREQLIAYREASALPDDDQLTETLAGYVYPSGAPDSALRLARYVRVASTGLEQQSWSEISAGRLTFPAFA